MAAITAMRLKRASHTVEKNSLKENILVDQARSGDVESFSALVEFHQERAVRAAYGFVGNLEDARDIAQEAFVKAYERLADFKGQSKFYTWLYRILVNGCKDFLRKKKWRQTFSFWFGKEEDESLDPTLQIADSAKNASEFLINKELGAALSQALEALPFRQKSVFVLRYLEGLGLNEIAEALRISVGAVKANLWQANQKMKRLLSE